jgi:amino acid transporter/nucleotide-binding universal stress UspA family protein
LGLLSLTTVGIGTMIGHQIFLVPGLAIAQAGSLALFAYALAASVALAAALSISELATAMPETGGSYHFVDRAMGPMLGTIGGLGTWLVSVLKGSFAAVGFGGYLRASLGLPVQGTAAALLLGLLGINVMGVRHTGRLQTFIVLLVLLGMGGFFVFGLNAMDAKDLGPPLPSGEGVFAVLPTAGLVILSYAGIVKMTAVSGEVREPGRTIPRAVLLSLLVVTTLYVMTVVVVTGFVTPNGLADPLTAVIDVAGTFLGPVGIVLLTGTALLALASVANAAVLLSGRYPYAMAHDGLVPRPFASLSRRRLTPYLSLATSALVMLLVIFSLDVATLAELLSAFTLLLFLLVNAAVIVMRRSASGSYRPTFRSPGYPWVQGFGLAGALVFLAVTQTVALFVMALFLVGGVVWYAAYARSRTTPRGELKEVVRRGVVRRAVAGAGAKVQEERVRILLPIDSPKHARDVFHVVSWLTGGQKAMVRAVKVEEIPMQTPLADAEALPGEVPEALKREVRRDAREFGLDAELVELFAHNRVHALLAALAEEEFDLLVLDWDGSLRRGIGHRGLRRLLHAPQVNTVVFRDRGLRDREAVLLASHRGPFDDLEVALANGAAGGGGRVTLLRVLPPEAPAAQEETERRYHEELQALLSVPTTSKIVRSRAPVAAIVEAARGHDLLVMRVAREPKLGEALFGETTDKVARHTTCSLVLTSIAEPRRRRFFKWILHRMLG